MCKGTVGGVCRCRSAGGVPGNEHLLICQPALSPSRTEFCAVVFHSE
jgi:hypothetical protein